jgi:hypothetical protein
MKNQLKKELRNLILAFVIFIVIIKIVFYKESLFVLLKLSSSLFYLYVLPLFFLTLLFFKDREFVERLIIAIPFNIAIVNILSYLLATARINFNSHHLFLPPLLFVISIVLLFKFHTKQNSNNKEEVD